MNITQMIKCWEVEKNLERVKRIKSFKYPADLREKAVEELKKPNTNVLALSERLGINIKTLRNWRTKINTGKVLWTQEA